jgi:hypothetical protein
MCSSFMYDTCDITYMYPPLTYAIHGVFHFVTVTLCFHRVILLVVTYSVALSTLFLVLWSTLDDYYMMFLWLLPLAESCGIYNFMGIYCCVHCF